MGADQRDVETAGNQRFGRWIGRRLGEACRKFGGASNPGCAWRELEAQQGEEREDRVPNRRHRSVWWRRIPGDIALVIQQASSRICRASLAVAAINLGEERRKTVGDVRIEFASRIVAVMKH